MADQSQWRWESIAERLGVFALHPRLYRWLGGRLVGRNVLLLETIGRRTGRSRCAALFYARDGGDYLIVASNGGADRYPGWWHNIRSNPHVAVQVGRRRAACRADAVSDAEAVRLWPRLNAVYGGYERYRAQTRRSLTIFRLRPNAAVDAIGDAIGAVRGLRTGGDAWTA